MTTQMRWFLWDRDCDLVAWIEEIEHQGWARVLTGGSHRAGLDGGVEFLFRRAGGR